jgi:glycine cleavage system H protein
MDAIEARLVLVSSRPEDFAAMDPKTLRFSPTHEWVHLDGDVATVGISKVAVEQLTDLMMIDLPAVGTKLARGESFGQVESVKSVNDLSAPVGGEVIEVNPAVTAEIQTLADDPFGKGWLIKLRVEERVEAADLLDHDAYERKVAEDAH